MIFYTEIETPLCEMRLTSDGDALTGLYFLPAHAPSSEVKEDWQRSVTLPVFAKAKEQLEAYFAGELREFSLPLSPLGGGTEFQWKVWKELMNIPYGETISYGELARRIGHPSSARAVGMANSKNPIGILVPCHRVIGSNGKLTGYAGGMPRKEALLALERQAR